MGESFLEGDPPALRAPRAQRARREPTTTREPSPSPHFAHSVFALTGQKLRWATYSEGVK